MLRYLAFDPQTEIAGSSVRSLITNIQHDEIASILERHRLTQVDAQAWYPLQNVLNVLTDISRAQNATMNFVSIGMEAARLGYETSKELLKHVSLEDFLLRVYPQVYATRMRYGDIGEIKGEKVDDKHYIITIRSPLPDDIFYGLFYNYVRILSPRHVYFTVRYDDVRRRELGHDVTILYIDVTS